MAKFVTFIADPELESSVLKAIAAINGELVVRGVSLEQIREAEKSKNATLICTRQIDFVYPRIIVDKSMSVEQIVELIKPDSPTENFSFISGNAKVICFVGLSGGVGTTTIAINHAFELSQKFKVILSDMDGRNPDIARALGLHRIEGRHEKISKSLSASQGLPSNSDCEIFVFDIGFNLNHPLLKSADEIYIVTRAGFNTLARLQELDISPKAVILNFAERTKAQQRWRTQFQEVFPRLDFVNIPLDIKSFEAAAESRSALLEVAGNSLARKSIATLG
ncbi:MAG: iron-transfer P-loop NTPase [Actinomycetota bacterium]